MYNSHFACRKREHWQIEIQHGVIENGFSIIGAGFLRIAVAGQLLMIACPIVPGGAGNPA